MRPALIFDLDGTLVDSLIGISHALNEGLRKEGLPCHSDEKVRTFIGNGSYQLALRALPEGLGEDVALKVEDHFKDHYAEHWSEGTTLYPGIDELISRLVAEKWSMAVLSNKPDPFTREIVDQLFPDQPFEQVVGQIDGSPRKPDPAAVTPLLNHWKIDPSQAIFIGDSTVDRETAEAARIPFLGVSWGYHDPSHLGPKVAESAAELASMLSNYNAII